jgi:hypothetical protein
MLILKIQREMELAKKKDKSSRRPPIARTEPRNSDTASINLNSVSDVSITTPARLDLNIERYK